MSIGMTMPPRQTNGWRQRARTKIVVIFALLLARLPPRRLKVLLGWAAARARPAGYRQTERYYHAVTAASLSCAGWQGCLPRSIAVALLCQLEGTWPTWCVGVRATPPFAAHAWLEADGRIVAELGKPDAYRALIRVEAGP
ncbi:lasso peptide biosynthesis B2 protein [Streptomyces sp. NPDC050703]|uniref:lasso peptide biosynthesis B2 protein n=1 Tax=Streptomyces sp. NPDC050703 TaxID=3157218 RepID=UPI00342CB4BD